jgi:hypothetical protein
MLTTLLFGKKSENSTNKATSKLSAVGVVEELFEEGSAMLIERYGWHGAQLNSYLHFIS